MKHFTRVNEKLEAVQWMIDNQATLRTTAKHYGFAKSALHYFIHHYLRTHDVITYWQVVLLMEINFEAKSYVGAEKTKQVKHLKKLVANGKLFY